MIFKCEQCQTRFKIPDDKVTDKGVKVRCTKCQHTFRVKRDGTLADAAAAPAAAAPDDPFAKFGPSTPAEAGSGELTRPGMFALGVEQTRNPQPLEPSFEAQAGLPKATFGAPPRVAKMPAPPPGRRPLTDPAPPPPAAAPAPFDFSALSAPPP